MKLLLHKRRVYWLFIFIPLGLLFVGFSYIYFSGRAFFGGVDPEYAYLFNGITLAHLHPRLNGVGHPGTPIQVMIAIVAWVVHLFRPGQSLWDDVMLNPELYIKATLYTANVINASFLFFLGVYVYRYSSNLVTALIFQLTPFAFLMTLEVSYRLMPELIMTSIISCWLIVLVKILYEPAHQRNYQKYSLIFALLFGFSMADKLTFISFFLLPFIILPSWKLRMKYTLLSALFFFIFAFPVLFNFPKFVHWVTAIFTHKGAYGGGEKGIVDWNVFSSNMKIILDNTWQLLVPLMIITSGILVLLIRSKSKELAVTIGLGIIMVVAVHFMITAKHYAFYYLTPSFLLAVFSGFIGVILIEKAFPRLASMKIWNIPLILFAIWLLWMVIPRSVRQLDALHVRKIIRAEAFNKIKPYLKHEPKIISPYYYGCYAIEYSLLFGQLESGRYGREITAEYQKHYPESYIYMDWADDFYNGIYNLEPKEFLRPNVDYTLYIADFSEEKLKRVITALNKDSSFVLTLKPVYTSAEPAEAVFKLSTTHTNP
jgi:hypothetical protein